MHLAIEIMVEDLDHGLGRQPVRQRGEAAQIRQPDRGLHGVVVTAADLAAENTRAGAVADIGVEQRRGGAAQGDDLADAGKRRHDHPDRRDVIIAEATGVPRDPARRMDRAIEKRHRHRDVVGHAFGAHVVEERKPLAVEVVHAAPHLDPLLEHDAKRALGEFGRVQDLEIDGADFDLLALPPDEVAAEDFRMQRADEDAEPRQRQAGIDQALADSGDHVGRGPRRPRAVDQPVEDTLEPGVLHGRICGRSCGIVKLRGGLVPRHEDLTPHLPAIAQKVIGQHAGHHGFADRDGADADAGVVAALGDDLGLVRRCDRRSGAASGSTRSASPRSAPRPAVRSRCRRERRRRGWTGSACRHCRCASRRHSPRRSARPRQSRRRSRRPSPR